MQRTGTAVRAWRVFGVALIAVAALAACKGGVGNVAAGNGPLPAISALPLPSLPPMVLQISPKGQVDTLAQIIIRFKDDLIPLEAIESPDQQSKLAMFDIQPPLPGHFRFLTPKMVGFEADRALPKAARIRVTLKAGLSDLKGATLVKDLAWTFSTEPIKITRLPTNTVAQALKPTIEVQSNLELEQSSLDQHVQVKSQKGGPVAINAVLEKEATPSPDEYDAANQKFDPSARLYIYAITPKADLAKATTYTLTFDKGLIPQHGNLPSDQTFSADFHTFKPLTFKVAAYGTPDANGAYGRFTTGSPQLEFNNGIDAASAKKNVSISPAPPSSAGLLQAYDGETIVSINPGMLAPDTDYTITVSPSLKDQFGQEFGTSQSEKFHTGDIAADVWAPQGMNIFPSDKRLQLILSTVNLPSNTVQVAFKQITPHDLVYHSGAQDLIGNPAWTDLPIQQKKNAQTNFTVPLGQKLGQATGMLAYGISSDTYRYEDQGEMKMRTPQLFGVVQLTNLGIFTQWFPRSGLIRVHHLSDGSPVASGQVDVYADGTGDNKVSGSPCGGGRTDAAGELHLAYDGLRQCYQQQSDTTLAPALFVVAHEGADWAHARSDSYSGAYGYGIDSSWSNGDPETRGVIYSDRQLYQPGEKVWLTGVAYYLKNDALHQDSHAQYDLKVTDPNGNDTDYGNITTNGYGTFSKQLTLKPNQPLGYYSVKASGGIGVTFEGSFRVAEFKPPNFKVDLTLDKEFAAMGDTVQASGKSDYLFGSPVVGGKYSFFVTRGQTTFTPKGWDQFTFGRQWFWPEQPPSVTSDVLQTTGTIDSGGNSSQSIAVANDLPYPMSYRVDMQTTDVSNLSVADSKSFTALPDARLIGLQSDYVANQNKPFSVQVIVTGPDGAVKDGENVHVELEQMQFAKAAQIVEGGETTRNSVQYKAVDSADVRSGTAPQTVSLTAKDSGIYRIRANIAGAASDASATDQAIWITGAGEVDWGDLNKDHLGVKLDKPKYKVGDTATVLVQSPYPEAELYFAVIRSGVIYRTVQHVTGGAPKVQFTVTPDMMPNAAVQAVLVRQGQPLAQTQPGSLATLAQVGFAPFATNLDDRYLKIQIAPVQAKVRPGGRQTVKLTLTDAAGKPTQGQFTVIVANEAVLQLSAYRPPDLVATIWAQQDIDQRFADNRPAVVLEQLASPLAKGWGYGGGFLAGAAGTRVRTNFQPLAYYNGALTTDAGGHAQVSFKVPDDLTTWRVMAVAIGSSAAGTGDELRFGNNDATFITSQPLLSNPVLPQFARPGDKFNGGVAITNNDNKSGPLSIEGLVQGPLRFDNNGQPSATTSFSGQAQPGTQAYRFPIDVSALGSAKARFTIKLGSESDAFELPIVLRALPIMEQAVDSGATNATAQIPLKVDQHVSNDAGGLEFSLASLLLPEFTASAIKDIREDEDLPFLEPISSQLSLTADLQVLATKYGQLYPDFKPQQMAAYELGRLAQMQHSDGGFGWYPTADRSDPFVTPYAAEAIGRAADAGFAVDPAMVSSLKSYLHALLADPGKFACKDSTPCQAEMRFGALQGLAALGERRTDYLSDIYDLRDQLSFVTQLKLARYLYDASGWQSQSTAMADKLLESVYETGRTSTVNVPQQWQWFDSYTTVQSQALRLYVAQRRSADVLDKLVRGLIAQRQQGTWPEYYENAEALNALVDYSRLQSPNSDFTATADLAGKRIASAHFVGYKNPQREVKVAMADLPRGDNQIALTKQGTGTLHYVVAYSYRLAGPQAGALHGLRVTRQVHNAGDQSVLFALGIAAPTGDLSLPAGQVYDIGLEIIADHPVDQVLVIDPLPAGLEAVDSSFATSTAYYEAHNTWALDYETIYKDRVLAYASHLDAGVYVFHYIARSVTPGTYSWPGAEARLQYAPEEFGRSASATLKITE
jgi:alpha-2-macroglobulin